MKKLFFTITACSVLLSCEKSINDSAQQEYVFGLQLSSHQLSLDYINLNTFELTSYSLPVQSGIFYRGTFDGNNNYYVSVSDTIYEIDITDNSIRRKFISPDTLLYLFNDTDKKLLTGVSRKNDTIGIVKISLTTGDQSFTKTSLVSDPVSFVTDAVYNTNDGTLIIKIGDQLNIVDVDNGEKISGFETQTSMYELRFSKSENCLVYIGSADNKLYYKKCDLKGNEKYSGLLETDIVGFFAGNSVLTDKNDYVFVAMDNDQKTKLYRINADGMSKKELKDFDALSGFSYVKK